MKRQIIRVGDQFKSNNGVLEVTEDRRFGRGYWVKSPDGTRQTIYQRSTLETMERIDKADAASAKATQS